MLATQLIRDTLQGLAPGAPVPAQYAAFIHFAREATPLEVAAIRSAPLPGAFRQRVDELYGWIVRAHPEMRTFRSSLLHPAVSLYSGRSKVGKHLVIGFSGKSQLLMMPISLFIQHVPDETFDVVLLRDTLKAGFSSGVPGFGSNLIDILSNLDRHLDFASYASLRTIGTSGGGAAALIAGRTLNAASAASVGGHLPSSSPRYGTGAGAARLENLLRTESQSRCRLSCVFGAEHPVDRREAQALAAISGASLVPVAGSKRHDALFQAFLNGTLDRLLEEIGLID